MKRAAHVVVALAASAAFVSLVGCKKNVDPNAFDAGATAQPVVANAAPSAPVAADTADAAAPLAPLASAAAVPVHKAAPKASAATAKVDPPECSNARTFCSSPKAATDDKIKHMCESFKAECVAKGGKI